VSYITFRFAKDYRHRKQIFTYLESTGCAKLLKNLWKLPLNTASRVKSHLNALNVPFTLLKKKREHIKIEKGQDNPHLGSLVLVAYSIPPEKNTTRTRKHISRLLRRSPYLRINRNMYAWPQINFKRFFPLGSKIISPRDFVKAIEELGGETVIIPRIVVEDKVARELIEEIKDIRRKECTSIYSACMKFIEQLKKSEIDVSKAKYSFNELKARFVQTKEIIFFLKKLYKIDLLKDYRKTLRGINSYKKTLHQKIVPENTIAS
jgi:hypothetical protein